MANILDYKNPLTGQKSNLLDFKGLVQMVLGVFVVLIAWAGGSYLMNLAKSKLPTSVTTAANTTANNGWNIAGGE